LLIDIERVTVEPGDKLLLCTDGLWRQFGSHDLADLLEGPVAEAITRLRMLAGRSHEDASAVLLEFAE
jgi:serine/threonine protein phosphatase PrpC